MKAQTFKTSVEGYDNAIKDNCWYKGDGPADDIKVGTIMLIVVSPPKSTTKPQDFITRPPILRKIVSISQCPDSKVTNYLKSYFKEKGKTIKLELESVI